MAHLAHRMHRQQANTHIYGAHTQASRRNRANRRTARHIVIRHELLIRHTSLRTRRSKHASTHRIRRITLVRVNLQQRTTTGQRLNGRVVVTLIVRVHQVTGISGQAERRRHRTAVLLRALTARSGQAHQNILQERASRTATRLRTKLLMVKRRKHHSLGSVLIRVIGNVTLQGGQTRMHRRQVIQAAGSEQLLIGTKTARRLRISEQQVVTHNALRVDRLTVNHVLRHVAEHIVLRRVHAPHGVHVELLVQYQFVALVVQVRRQLRDARNRTGAHQAVLQLPALKDGEAARHAQLTVQEGVQQCTTIVLHGNLVPALRGDGGGRLDLQGGRVGVRTQHAVAACLLRLRAASPGDNRAVTDDEVAAGCNLRVPCFGLYKLGEARCLQAARYRARGEVRDRRLRHECGEVFNIFYSINSHGLTLPFLGC